MCMLPPLDQRLAFDDKDADAKLGPLPRDGAAPPERVVSRVPWAGRHGRKDHKPLGDPK